MRYHQAFMGWQGKAIGVSLGSFLGPWGALAGAAAGHFLMDRKAVPPEKQRLRLLAVSAAALHELACVEGRYPVKTDRVIRAILEEINRELRGGLSAHELAYLIDDAVRLDQSLARLAQMVRGNPGLARAALIWLWRVAVSNGDESPQAVERIDWYVRQSGVSAETARQVTFFFSRHAGTFPSEEGRCTACTVLGVPYQAGVDQIKTAYRKLSQTYHPDKHAALDPAIRALTAEKFAQVKQAYDQLCGTRTGELFACQATTGELVPAVSGLTVVCLRCGQSAQFRADQDLAAVRCLTCQSLLAFDRERLVMFQSGASRR